MPNRNQIVIPFNPDTMTVSDLKACATALRGIMEDYARFHDDPEEMILRLAQIADRYVTTVTKGD